MANEIRIGKISAIDYSSGTVRVVYHDKDDNVTTSLPLLSGEYSMPAVGDLVLVLHLSNGKEAGVVLGRFWSEKNKPPEGAAKLFRKDLGSKPGEAVLRYDGKTLSIQCTGDISIEAKGALRIKGTTIDLN